MIFLFSSEYYMKTHVMDFSVKLYVVFATHSVWWVRFRCYRKTFYFTCLNHIFFHHLFTNLLLSIRDILIINNLFELFVLFYTLFLKRFFFCTAHTFKSSNFSCLISFCLNSTDRNYIDYKVHVKWVCLCERERAKERNIQCIHCNLQ